MNADDVVADVKSTMTGKKVRRYSEPGQGRRVRRPEEILRDVRGLKLRQRVSLVLGDEILRDELENTIKNSTLNGVSRLDTIRTYQDFLLPTFQSSLVNVGKGGGGGSTVLPINDIKGNSTLDYCKSEKIARNKLAATYRLVDLMGWSETIFNHISVRSNSEKQEFLLNPFGLLFSEVSSSSLIKCDLEGNILDGGSTSLGLNKAGFVLHSCIHEFRPDVHCIIHVHTPNVIAVSAMKCGFLRLSQESLIVGNVSYHDYCGILVDENEKESIRKDLGTENKVMFLRNHGVLVCGRTIEDTVHLLFPLMDACETQVKAIPIGLDNLNIISDAAFDQVQEVQSNIKSQYIGSKGNMTMSEYLFEAYMRWLDSQGYRTGYIYHIPDVFISGDSPKKFPESRVPPQVTSDRNSPYQVYYDYQAATPGARGAPSMGRGNSHRHRLKWLNNPVQGTQYRKEERAESTRPVLDPPVLDERPPLTNGHYEENITETVHNDTKVVTKTTTVTETQVITELSSGKSKETVAVNIDDASQETNVIKTEETIVEITTPEPTPSPEKSNAPSENGSTMEVNGDNLKSPTKVKKQKSFKKALMKKFKKEEKDK